MKGKWIEPKPGFALKSKLVQKYEKFEVVYINLCIHDDIDVPGMKKRLNEEGESVEGLNIPMSVGPKYEVIDEDSSAAALAYDVIVNGVVLREASDDKTGKYRDFICQLCIQYIEAKLQQLANNLMLDKRYSLLPYAFKGKEGVETPAAQYVQDRKNMPKIEILEEENASTSSSSSKKAKAPATAAKRSIMAEEASLVYRLAWRGTNAQVINGQDYVDPIQSPPIESDGKLSFHADIIAAVLTAADVVLQASPYRMEVKIPGYKLTKIYFPCAVFVPGIKYEVHRVEGYTQRFVLEVSIPVDRTSVTLGPDPGSKQWLVAQALADDDGRLRRSNIYEHHIDSSTSTTTASATQEEYPEDKFHIRLPDDVDQYTGIKKEQEEEFPEDRFHRQDASSSFLINQREQAIKEKALKREQ
jgi:hypothetical protein